MLSLNIFEISLENICCTDINNGMILVMIIYIIDSTNIIPIFMIERFISKRITEAI